LPERPKEKSSAELKKEKRQQKLAEAKNLAKELHRLYNKLRSKLSAIEKSGAIPEEGLLRGFRKNLQYLSSGLRKLRRAGVEASFGHGQVNTLTGKLNKWLAGGGAVEGAARAEEDKGRELDEILNRIRFGAATIADPAIHDAILMLREIAKEKIMGKRTAMVAERAKRLLHQRKRSEAEIENFLKDRCVVPILSSVFRAFLSELESVNVELDEEVKNYIETCVKGGRSRKEFINLLLEREAVFQPPSQFGSFDA
jgi:hypothetical protein